MEGDVWLWLLLVARAVVDGSGEPVFLLVYPICLFVFFWFAYIRYDEMAISRGLDHYLLAAFWAFAVHTSVDFGQFKSMPAG